MQLSRKKTLYTEHHVDAQTGELNTVKWITRQAVNKEEFVLMYINDLCKLNKLSNANYRLLTSLAIYLEYNTNEFYLNPKRKQEIAEFTGLKFTTINQNISILVKKKMLIRISTSTYQMNPLLFFKGEEIARSKYLELTVRYEICPDCK